MQIPPNQTYRSPGTAFVEGDASSASYFLAAAAVTGGSVVVEGCGTDSLQGDTRFASVLESMGASLTWQANSIELIGPQKGSLRAVDEDCGDIPDAAMTLAVVALFANGYVEITLVAILAITVCEVPDGQID